MSSQLVLLLLLAQSLNAPSGSASWPAEFEAAGSLGHFGQGDFYGGWQGSGSGGATWFLRRPVVDDGTPFALQSYLQRLDRLALGFGGSGFSARDDLTLYEHRGNSLSSSLAGQFYVGDLILGGELYYSRLGDVQAPAPSTGQTGEERHTTQVWYPELVLGLRHEDTELVGEYRLKSYYDDGIRRSLGWGQATLRLRSVLEREISWHVEAYTLVDGGGADFDVEFFSRQDLGVWFSGYFEEGRIYANSSTDYERLGVSLGLGWWSSDSVELQFSLAFSTAKRTVPSTDTHHRDRKRGHRLASAQALPGKGRAAPRAPSSERDIAPDRAAARGGPGPDGDGPGRAETGDRAATTHGSAVAARGAAIRATE